MVVIFREAYQMNEISKTIVNETEKYIRTHSFGRFPKPKEPRKFKRAFFMAELKAATATGQWLVIESLLNGYAAGKYENLDDMVADLHIIGAEVLNDFRMTASDNKCRPFSVEDMLPGGNLVSKA